MAAPATILIVDDTADMRLLLQVMLEDDYTLVTAGSGKECLEKVQTILPDLILLDVNMPEMNGYEVCVQLRKQAATRSLPVIFVSALDSAEERLRGFEAGGDEYVTKPVDRTGLLEKIKVRLAHHKQVIRVGKEKAGTVNVTVETMASSIELGKIIQLTNTLNLAGSEDSVAQATCHLIEAFSLDVCIMVAAAEPIFKNCEADSLEAKLMQQFRDDPERIVSAGFRTIIRCENIVALVKNMPADNENMLKRLKDYLLVSLDMANNRLCLLLFQLSTDARVKS